MSAAAQALPRGELVLDRYRPLRPLGSGGSGSVWLARDERNGLDVALRSSRARARRPTAQSARPKRRRRLRHERCLRAYGFGSDSGHVYIAYEYVGGRTLRDAMRGGELRDGQAVEAAAQILDGLAHAHSRGIVHRDVKPSNVLLADGRRDLGAPARLRPGAVRRGRDADRGRRRPRHARLHLARAPPRRGGVLGERHLGASGSCSGRRSPASTRSGACRCRRWPGRSRPAAPPLQPERPDLPKRLLSAIVARARPRPGPAAARRRAGEGAAVARSPATGARRRSSVSSPHALAERRGRLPRRAVSRPLRRRDDAALLPAGLGAGARSRRPHSPRSGRRAPGSRSRSPRRCSRSATSRSGWRCSTARSRSAGSRSTGATRAAGSRSSPGRCSPPSGCSRSCRSRSPSRGDVRRAAPGARRGRRRRRRRRAARRRAPVRPGRRASRSTSTAPRAPSTAAPRPGRRRPGRPRARGAARSPRSPSRSPTPGRRGGSPASGAGALAAHAPRSRRPRPRYRSSRSPSGSRCGGLGAQVRALDSCCRGHDSPTA